MLPNVNWNATTDELGLQRVGCEGSKIQINDRLRRPKKYDTTTVDPRAVFPLSFFYV